MTTAPIARANVKQALAFFKVTNMETSLRYYIDGLGFKMKHWWIPDRVEDKPDGRIRWCWLELGDAAIMLQEFCRDIFRRKRLEREHRSASCAKMPWRCIASSNHVEYRHGNVRLLGTASG